MKRLTLTTLATLAALSPAVASTAEARDRTVTTCNDRGRCVEVERNHNARHPQKSKVSREVVVNRTVVTRKPTVVRTMRALPGRAVTAAELRRLPHQPKGRNYRVVNNRVVVVDDNTAEVVAALGLLALLLDQ